MENLGLIVLRANGDDIFFMLFFICVVVVLAYGIGCLGRKLYQILFETFVSFCQCFGFCIKIV